MNDFSPLIRWLTADLPVGFLQDLLRIAPQVYAESWTRTYGDPLFGRKSPEAHDLIGHERNALFQSRLPAIAAAHHLSCVATLNPRRTSNYRLVRAGHFILTASAVRSQKDHPRLAVFRKRNAGINRLLAQRVLAFMPLAEIQSEQPGTNGIILHGPDSRNPRECGFVMIGIPSPTLKRWVFCESIQYLIAAHVEQDAAITPELVLDNVHPRRRTERRSGGDGA